jgi:hypothetical protein
MLLTSALEWERRAQALRQGAVDQWPEAFIIEEIRLSATSEPLDAVWVQPVGLHLFRRGVSCRQRGKQCPLLPPNGPLDDLVRTDALRDLLT